MTKPNYDAAAITELAKIPTTGDVDLWDEAQKHLAEVLGFTTVIEKQTVIAPRGVREAFLIALDRTKLDPLARQIYLAYIGGKWLIITGIDGFRLIAQRSGEYRGQTPVEWTDGVEYPEYLMSDGKPVLMDGKPIQIGVKVLWVPVWTKATEPAAARVGVLREGFADPVYGIATWKAYGKTKGQWVTNGPHMLSIRAEAQALRKAFPQELSGLYTADEMEQAEEEGESLGRDWAAEAKEINTDTELRALYDEMAEAGEWNKALDAVFKKRKAEIAIAAAKAKEEESTVVVEELVDAK